MTGEVVRVVHDNWCTPADPRLPGRQCLQTLTPNVGHVGVHPTQRAAIPFEVAGEVASGIADAVLSSVMLFAWAIHLDAVGANVRKAAERV
nr:hypothetical protein CFP56_16774 [Quercus suber]